MVLLVEARIGLSTSHIKKPLNLKFSSAPGLIRTISAMVFPVGLIMVVLTGADLFTSYCMYSVVAFLHRRCSFFDILKTWFVSFIGNLAGALFFMAVLTGCMFTP